MDPSAAALYGPPPSVYDAASLTSWPAAAAPAAAAKPVAKVAASPAYKAEYKSNAYDMYRLAATQRYEPPAEGGGTPAAAPTADKADASSRARVLRSHVRLRLVVART